MSRHTIPCKNPAYYAVVGWDNHLETFFGQVIDSVKENDDVEWDDYMVTWVGAEPNDKILTIGNLQDRLKDYTMPFPADVVEQLAYDYNNREEPSAIALWVRRMSGENL